MSSIFTAAIVLLSLITSAQSNEEWLSTIKRNAADKKPGYALYFSQAGAISVPYLVYIPKSYNLAKAIPAVVFLHGAILAKDSFQYKDPSIANEPVFSIADACNTIIIFPFARQDFKWSGQEAAFENIIAIMKQVEQDYNVDKKRVYLGGISMGGNATFWFINNRPEMFAGFYTFSAMPRSTTAPIKFSNITKEKPLFSVNAKDDPVFPYTDVKATYELHKKEAPGWHFESVETGGHRFIYANGGSNYVKTIINNLLASGK